MTPQPAIPPTEVPQERNFETGVWAFFKAFVLVGMFVVVMGWGAWQVVLHFWSFEAQFTDPIAGGHRNALEDAGFEIVDASYGPRLRDGPVNGASINIDVQSSGCEPEDASCVREVFESQDWATDFESVNDRGSFRFTLGDPDAPKVCGIRASIVQDSPPPSVWHLFVEC